MKAPEQQSETPAPEARPVLRDSISGLFLPGNGGRPKGSKNAKLPSPVDTALAMGVDPAAYMLHIVKHGSIQEPDGSETKLDPALRVKVLAEVAPYVHIKPQTTIVTDTRITHLDLTVLMQDPALVDAAERIALAMLGDSPAQIEEPKTFDISPDSDEEQG